MRDLLEKIDSISEYSIKKVGDTTEIDKDIDNAVAPRGISRDYTPQKLEQKLEWLINDHAGFFKVVNDDYIKNRFYGRLAQTLKLRAFTAPDGTTVSTELQKDGTFKEFKKGDLTSARKQNELGWLDQKIAKKYNLKWNDKFKEIEPEKEPEKDDKSSSPDYKNHGKQDFFSGGGQVKVKWNGTDVPQLSKDNWQDWIKLGNELLNRYVESVELGKSFTLTESIRLTLQQLFEQEEMSDQDKENWKVLLQQFSMFGKSLPPEAKSAFDNLQKRKTKYDLKFSVDDTMDIDSPADKNATTNLDWSDRKNFLPIIDKALQQYITTGNLDRAFTPPYNAKDNPTLMSALGALRKNFNAQTGEDENGIISIYKHGGIEEVWPEIAKMMSDDSGDELDKMVPDHNLVKWQGKNVQALDRYNAELWLKRANQLLAKYPDLFNTSKNESRINEEGFGDTLKGLWDKGVSALSGDSKEQPEVQSKERLPNVEEIEPTFMRPEDQKEWVRLSDMFSQTALPDKFAREWETINQKLVQSKKTATARAGSKWYDELDPSSKKSTKMVQYQGKEVEELNRGNWKEWINRAQRLLAKYAYTYGSKKKTESIHEELRYYIRLVEKGENIDWSKIEIMSADDERDWNTIKNMFSRMVDMLPDEATNAWEEIDWQKRKGDVYAKAKQRAQADTDDPALGGSSGFDPGTKSSGTFKGNADDVERDAERDAADARLKTQANANDRLDKFKQDKTDGTQYAKSKGDLGYYADYINAVLSNPTADNLVTQANKVLGEVGFFDTRWNAMNNFYGIIAQELGLEGLISHVDTAVNPPQVFYSRAKQTELSKKLGDKMPRGEFESDNVDFSDPKHRKIAQAQLNKNLLPASITYQQQKVNPQEEFGITKTADDSTKPMMSQDDIEKKYGITSDEPAAAEPAAAEPTSDEPTADKNKPSVDGGQAANKVGSEFGKKYGQKYNKDKMPTGTYAYDRYVPIPKNLNRLFRGDRKTQYYVDRIPLPGRGLMSSQLQITSDTKGTGFETVHDTKFNRARDAIYQFLKDNNTALIDQAEWAKLKKWNDMAGDGPGGGDILNAPNDRWKTKRKDGSYIDTSPQRVDFGQQTSSTSADGQAGIDPGGPNPDQASSNDQSVGSWGTDTSNYQGRERKYPHFIRQTDLGYDVYVQRPEGVAKVKGGPFKTEEAAKEFARVRASEIIPDPRPSVTNPILGNGKTDESDLKDIQQLNASAQRMLKMLNDQIMKDPDKKIAYNNWFNIYDAEYQDLNSMLDYPKTSDELKTAINNSLQIQKNVIDKYKQLYGSTANAGPPANKNQVAQQDGKIRNAAPDSSLQDPVSQRRKVVIPTDKITAELPDPKDDYEQYKKNLRKKDNSSTDFTRLLKNAGLLKEFY